MRKLMGNVQFRTRLGGVAKLKRDVESAATFGLLALAVRLYIRFQDVPPSFITLTEFLLYLEGQHNEDKAALWKRVYRDGPNVAKARQALEGAVLADEGIEMLREKYQAFVQALTERSMLQAVSAKVYREEPVVAPECTGVAASWCPVCGDCACSRREDGELEDENVPSDECPLHGFRSKHAERNPAREERELLQSLVLRALDRGQKPKCQRCCASWELGKATRCTDSGGEHDWGLELK